MSHSSRILERGSAGAEVADLPLPRASLIKLPRQRRSVEMVHRIIDAGIGVLARDGYVGFSTHRVAETAGISVGSLYQYFASKEMIVSAIIERSVMQAEQMLAGLARRYGDRDPEFVLRRAIRAVNRFVAPFRPAIRELLVATPVLSDTGLIALLRRPFVQTASEYFLRNADRYEVIGGVVTIEVAVDLLVFAILRRWSDYGSVTGDAEYYDALVPILLSRVRERPSSTRC